MHTRREGTDFSVSRLLKNADGFIRAPSPWPCSPFLKRPSSLFIHGTCNGERVAGQDLEVRTATRSRQPFRSPMYPPVYRSGVKTRNPNTATARWRSSYCGRIYGKPSKRSQLKPVQPTGVNKSGAGCVGTKYAPSAGRMALSLTMCSGRSGS